MRGGVYLDMQSELLLLPYKKTKTSFFNCARFFRTNENECGWIEFTLVIMLGLTIPQKG